MTKIDLRAKTALLHDLSHVKIHLPPWKPREVADRLFAVLKIHSKDGVIVLVTEAPEDPLTKLVDRSIDQMLQSLIAGASVMEKVPSDAAIASALRDRAGDDFAKVWSEYVEDLGM